MFSYRSLLLFTLLTTSTLCFSFSHGETHFPTTQTPPFSGEINEGGLDGVVYLGTKRFLAEGPDGDESESPPNSSYLVLAAKRTYRRDPLNGFKKYTGGYNISERHYWASVGFTAAPFFIIAAIWFFLFGLCLSLICLCYCCCRREPYGYSKTAYALSLIFLILFTVAAIVGCVVLYTGQRKFHDSTTTTLDYVVNQAETTVEKLVNVSEYLSAAKQVGVDRVFLPSNVGTDIDEIQSKINTSATTLRVRTSDNSGNINDLLDSVILNIRDAISCVHLGDHWMDACNRNLYFVRCISSSTQKLGVAAAPWSIHESAPKGKAQPCKSQSVTADTCVSMDQWIQNPTAHTALDNILPCMDNATAQETLLRSKEVTSQLVNVVNQVITNVSNINFAPNFTPLFYNQSGPLMPTLCNPYNPDLTNRVCASGEVDLNNATEVWRNYVCQVSANDICTTTGRLTPSIYNQMTAGVNVSYGLYHYGPFLVDLQDCTFARQSFTDIYLYHCPGLQRYSEWIYVGLVMVSVAVMLSLVFWVIYGRERRHRVYTKQFSDGMDRGFEGDKHT
ncbi:hypothetical protein RHMOL_Rhmol07G0192600 [Rhododendron molle]|uniref:Uncharacterized protein n=1 Tax=Rhododendron molle TaxID=49168 RepID=A0ACC0N254_RHOML|nr:hypothetical protein RHMOL_Rhmol07G0192600 [Rhododendron molle]